MIPFNPLRENPPEPWEERTYYLINVSWRNGNPFHKALLYTGFLNNGKPCGYSGIFHHSYKPEYMKLSYDKNLKITIIKNLGRLLEE